MGIAGLVVGQDVTTAVLGALNAGYFGGYWWRSSGTRGRRIGAAALAWLSVATVVEALFSQGLFWSEPTGLVSNEAWALLRLPLFLATFLISAIIARRLAG